MIGLTVGIIVVGLIAGAWPDWSSPAGSTCPS